MSGELPVRDEKHVSGEGAVLAVKNSVPPEWIVRDQTNDYGIDLEIEFAGKAVSGRLCKAQVRGHRRVSWTQDGTYLQQARQTTMNYWAAMPVPVVMLVPDTDSGQVYWAFSDLGRESGGVRVHRSAVLSATARDLERQVIDWLDVRGGNAVLYSLPLFAERWKRAQESVGRDCFLTLDDEDYLEAQELYARTMLLRQAVGLSYADMFSWDLWSARSRVTFGKDGRLYWGTYDEIIKYLSPLVDETMLAARHALKVQAPTAANAVAMGWAMHEEGSNVWYEIEVPTLLAEEPQDFWRRMDAHLGEQRVLKYAAADGWRFQSK